jgi:hypothetical protein
MFKWFNEEGYRADLEALRREYPSAQMTTLHKWLEKEENILPRYARAGVEKLAFLHPAGSAPTSAPTVEPGAQFPTGHFDSRRRAEGWLASR